MWKCLLLQRYRKRQESACWCVLLYSPWNDTASPDITWVWKGSAASHPLQLWPNAKSTVEKFSNQSICCQSGSCILSVSMEIFTSTLISLHCDLGECIVMWYFIFKKSLPFCIVTTPVKSSYIIAIRFWE